MWKLWHKLFGWDYVLVSFGLEHCIRRVHWTLTSEPYVIIYGRYIFLEERTHRTIRPLTFHSLKRTEPNTIDVVV